MKKIKKLFKKLKELAKNLNTPITEQDSSGYFILNKHSEKIIIVAKENDIHIPEGIVLGTLPLNYLDAFTCVFPRGKRLVVLSEGVFLFLYSMGRVVSSFFSKGSTNNKNYDAF